MEFYLILGFISLFIHGGSSASLLVQWMGGVGLLALVMGWVVKRRRKMKREKFIESMESKHAFITGGSSGIGMAIAKVCLQEGAFVTLAARNLPNLLLAKDFLISSTNCDPCHILIKVMDVSNRDKTRNAIEEAFKWRPIDVLVCNAAIVHPGNFEEADTTCLEDLFKVDLMGCVYPIHVALPLIKQRSASHPSSIVFLNSVSGLSFCSGAQLYSPIKYAQRGLANTMRMELSPYNIQVSLAFPFFTKTPMLNQVGKLEDVRRNLFNCLHFYNEEEALSAEEVAIAIVEGFKKGKCIITTEVNGYFSKILSRGIVPSNSIVENVVEVLFLIPFRAYSFILSWNISRIIHDPKFSKLFPIASSNSFKMDAIS